jgi:hypothetical protein
MAQFVAEQQQCQQELEKLKVCWSEKVVGEYI